MPSVGMRRSTRVFGARVLRSGRRLWMEPFGGGGSKYVRAVDGETKWAELLDNSVDGAEDAGTRGMDSWQELKNSSSVDPLMETRTEESVSGSVEVEKRLDCRFGVVYARKRKRVDFSIPCLAEDKRFGKKFVRKEWKRRCRAIESFETCQNFLYSVSQFGELGVTHQPSCGSSHWVARLLFSVLSYMTRFRIGMRQLYGFLISKPLFNAYSSIGVHFLKDAFISKNPGVCIISGSRSSVPMFYFTFSAVPSLSMHMQTILYFRFASLSCLVLALSLDVNEEVLGEESSFQVSPLSVCEDCRLVSSQISPGRDIFTGYGIASGNNSGRNLLQPAVGLPKCVVGLPKCARRSIQLRNSRKIRKRRSSLRHRRGVPTSAFRSRKTTGAVASDLLRIKQEGTQISVAATSRVLRSSRKKSSTENIKELKFSFRQLTQEKCAHLCFANLLVTQTDKCYREEGVTVALELSLSREWVLAIKKDGTKRYCLTAQKVMRPSGSNRFTHAIIWNETGSWKLEFPCKQDWMIFRELYKECYERNVLSPAASVIPVPWVQDVRVPIESNHLPFVRPDSYISVEDDELVRALRKKYANYDMDSDDEQWLAKLKDNLYAGRELQELVTPDSFELVIDALEKCYYCNADENFDEQAAYEFCMHIERSEVIEAIRNYWVQKRKQRRSTLIKVFQLYQPRRAQLMPKSILRKKRSFKRQANHHVKDNRRPLLQAKTAEQEALEQQNNAQKVQDATAAADRLEELAILNRQRAQDLMIRADLATYKALMTLRVAEAAQLTDNAGEIASVFHG